MEGKLNIKEFSKLYKNYYAGLYGFVLAIVDKKSIADDICKEAFKDAVLAVDPISNDEQKALTLFKSAREKAALIIVSRARKVEWTDVLEGSEEDKQHKDIDEMKLLIPGIADFDRKQRQVAVLKAEGFSDQFIADVMDLPKQSIVWFVSQNKLEFKNAGKDYKSFESSISEILDKNAPDELGELQKEFSDIFRQGKNKHNVAKTVKTVVIILLAVILAAAVGLAVYYIVNNSDKLPIQTKTETTTQATTEAATKPDYASYGFDSVNIGCTLPLKEKFTVYKPMTDEKLRDSVVKYFKDKQGLELKLSADSEKQGVSSEKTDDYTFSISDKYGFFEYKYLKADASKEAEWSEADSASCEKDAEKIISDLRKVYGDERFPELKLSVKTTEASVSTKDTKSKEEVYFPTVAGAIYEFVFVPQNDVTADRMSVENSIVFSYNSDKQLIGFTCNIYGGQFEQFGEVKASDFIMPLIQNMPVKSGNLTVNSVTPVYIFGDEYLLTPAVKYTYTLDSEDYTAVEPLEQHNN